MKILSTIGWLCILFISGVQAQVPSESSADKLQDETVSLFNQGKYQEALASAKQIISTREKELGKQHPKVASDLANLAAIYYKIGNYSESESNYEKALKIYESMQLQDEEALIKVLNMLASCAEESADRHLPYDSNSAGKAVKLYQRSLALTKKRYGQEHLEVGKILSNLGRNQINYKKYSDAEASFKSAISILEKTSGLNNRLLAEPIEGLACLYMKSKKQAEAAPLHSRVNLILQQTSLDKNAPIVFPFKTFACRAVAKNQPAYPSEAKLQRAIGRVLVQVDVDESGLVEKAVSNFPNRVLANAAIDAARRWQFVPALVNQKPVKMSAYIFFNFILQ